MSPAPTPPLAPPLSEALYARAYALRKAASTMTDEASAWLREAAEGFVARSCAEPGQPFTVLSVGAGEGDLDLDFAAALIDTLAGRPLLYRALEPNPEHRAALRARIAAGSWPANTRFEVSAERFEEAKDGGPYDVILMCHVLYYLNVRTTIAAARGQLAPTGSIVVVHQTGEGIPPLQRQFMADLKGDHAELLTTDDIRTAIDDANAVAEFHHRDAWLDVTPCLEGTAEGLDILSFCLECDLRPLAPTRVAPLIDALRNASSVRADGRRVLREPIGIFVVPTAEEHEGTAPLLDPVDDYRRLAAMPLWNEILAPLKAGVRVLDVACGSGRWLRAFAARHGPTLTERLAGGEIFYDLLEPNGDASARCAARLRAPLRLGQTYVQTIEAGSLPTGTHDLIWSMHGFYAVPVEALPTALCALRASLTPRGRALLAISTRRGVYTTFYRHWLDTGRAKGEPFTSAEDIEQALRAEGMHYDTHTLCYNERIPACEEQRLSNYLLHEAIGNSFVELGSTLDPLEVIKRDPVLGPYLEGFLHDGVYALPQEVRLIVFSAE